VNCVPAELLDDLAGRVPEIPTRDSDLRNTQPFNLDQWISARGLEVSGPSDWKGGRRWIFSTCPWNSNHDNASAFILQFPSGAIAAGCLHNGCRGKDWQALRSLFDPNLPSHAARERSATPAASGTGWDPPVPFHQFDLPSFPTTALPAFLRDFVESVATATQTPVDLAAMLALAVVAASCAKKVAVRVKPGYFEPVNIFVVVSLAPANRKSAVFSLMAAPLEEHEQRELGRIGPVIARTKATLKIKEITLRKLQEKAVGAKGGERERLIDEAANLSAEIAETPMAAEPRYIADDCTPERLSTLLHDQAGRLAVMSPEGDVFDLMAGRYSTNATSNLGVYLKGHAGDALRVDRVGRPPECVRKPALSIGLAVQPEVIRGLIDKPGFRGRGLLGRFLYSLPDSLLGRRRTDPPPIPDDIRLTYNAKVRALLEIPLEAEKGSEPEAHELRFDVSAQSRMQDFERWIEPQLSEFGELGGITDWAGKLVGAVGRIAGILHIGAFAGTPASWDYQISLETTEGAIQIAKYLIPHAKAAFAEMGADVHLAYAKKILRWIEQNRALRFTRRELHQAMRGTFRRVEELDAPLALLAAHEFVRKEEEGPKGGPGRRPSPVHCVNPIWACQIAEAARPGLGGSDSEYCENFEKGLSPQDSSEESDPTIYPQNARKRGT
jgi:replicative DNA helicase